MVSPLDSHGRIDQIARRAAPRLATVRRFWDGERDATGHMVHGGLRQWGFSYGVGREDDELVPHLSEHVFRAGEYLAVREATSTLRVMQVVSVIPVSGCVDANGSEQTKIGAVTDDSGAGAMIEESHAWSKNEATRAVPTRPPEVGVMQLHDSDGLP